MSSKEDGCVRSAAVIGTIVTVRTVRNEDGAVEAVERALEWFFRVEECCNRFDPESELCRLSRTIGEAVPVSTMLFQAVQFAIAMAEETHGAFDPTLGLSLEKRGFNREYRSHTTVHTEIAAGEAADYHDVQLDAQRGTITLLKPLLLDLGAVAKGLAIDMAAQELKPFRDFSIGAGGDLYMGGHNFNGLPWSVGIRHPRAEDALIDTVTVSDRAVCTSGDYERGRHILDPRSGEAADLIASVTAIAPSAILADAVSTAAFVLGTAEGIRLFERTGVEGLIVTSELKVFRTGGDSR